ncbi:MAG TPA: SelB C-terminal domain-containing protein [Verrucomicrobiae bacterium]|nr:SelB C-terminal domain-containing protein [Verrucomicrobiae bacterium]
MSEAPGAERAVGTAGHVDHGKTALVRALTGVDGDRLDAERQRGMTIVCGFTPWRLPGGREVSVVDVPGHERFVRTMATGVGSIDLALLCVAVDDGVMPQTTEHAAVLRLLGVTTVVVAVTKVDLAPERATAVGAAGAALAARLGLEVAGTVGVSARTGSGLDRLAAVVAAALDRGAPAPDRGLPRLFVDRSFTAAGVGTIVTGTLDGGVFRVGEPVCLWPSQVSGRVLALQRRGRAVPAAAPGGRLAMALRGVPLAAAPRGSVVAAPGSLDPTALLDVLLEVPQAGASGIRHGARVECLHGTRALSAEVWLAGEREIGPGRQGFGQLRLAGPAAALAGDRVLLRSPAPAATLGGGLLLDPHPPRHRRWTSAPLDGWSARARLLARADAAGPVGLVEIEARSAPAGLDARSAGRRAGVPTAAAREALAAARARGDLLAIGGLWIAPDRWARLEQRAAAVVAAYRAAEPLGPGVARTTLLRQLGVGPADGSAVLDRLRDARVLELHGGVVRAPDLAAAADDPVVRRVRILLEGAGLDAPGADRLREAGATPRVLGFLRRTGAAVEVAPGVLLASPAFHAVVGGVTRALADHPQGLSVSELRQQLRTSRRVMVPLLERLLREGRTQRVGALHRLVPTGAALPTGPGGDGDPAGLAG